MLNKLSAATTINVCRIQAGAIATAFRQAIDDVDSIVLEAISTAAFQLKKELEKLLVHRKAR